MSAATEQAIRDAIEAHFADEVDNGIIRGWTVTMVGQAIDDAMAPDQEARRSSAHTLPTLRFCSYTLAIPRAVCVGWPSPPSGPPPLPPPLPPPRGGESPPTSSVPTRSRCNER